MPPVESSDCALPARRVELGLDGDDAFARLPERSRELALPPSDRAQARCYEPARAVGDLLA